MEQQSAGSIFDALNARFWQVYRKSSTDFFCAPGRTEICGNHCDHQHGMVIAAAVDFDIVAAVAYRKDKKVHMISDGFGEVEVDFDDFLIHEEELGTAAALIRGIAKAFKDGGFLPGGFDAIVASSVPAGSGLSSSAAFEVLVGNIFAADPEISKEGKVADPLFIAKAGQYAENNYFGKPSGLMDQLACSFGGMIFMDLEDPYEPKIEQIDAKAVLEGYQICLVNTGSSHADLTDDYAMIPAEMAVVAEYFGKEYLREVDPEQFSERIGELRNVVTERAVLRAMHFFDEEERVLSCKEAIKNADTERFLDIIRRSGRSSWELLQNVSPSDPQAGESLALALAVSEKILNGEGAARVHGGGFAGSIQAFVPDGMVQEYCQKMDDIFGQGACSVIDISPEGGRKL